MFSILNRALSWAITSFWNKFYLKKRPRLIKALDNRFYVKFMQLEIGLFRMVYKVDGNPQLDTCDWSMSSNILNRKEFKKSVGVYINHVQDFTLLTTNFSSVKRYKNSCKKNAWRLMKRKSGKVYINKRQVSESV